MTQPLSQASHRWNYIVETLVSLLTVFCWTCFFLVIPLVHSLLAAERFALPGRAVTESLFLRRDQEQKKKDETVSEEF